MDEEPTPSNPLASKLTPSSQQKPNKNIEFQVAYDTLISAYDRIHRLQRVASQRPLGATEKENEHETRI